MGSLLEGIYFHHLTEGGGEPAATYAKQHDLDHAELFMKELGYSQKKTGGGLDKKEEQQLLSELKDLEFKVKTDGIWVKGTDKDFKGFNWSSQK